MKSHSAGEFGPVESTPILSKGAYEEILASKKTDAETGLIEIVGGREGVLFLAPMGAHGSVAVEAWQVVEQRNREWKRSP